MPTTTKKPEEMGLGELVREMISEAINYSNDSAYLRKGSGSPYKTDEDILRELTKSYEEKFSAYEAELNGREKEYKLFRDTVAETQKKSEAPVYGSQH